MAVNLCDMLSKELNRSKSYYHIN